MHAVDREINRTWDYGDPLDINEDRAQSTFGMRLRQHSELLDTPMRQQAVKYLSSLQFLQDATRAMNLDDRAFRPAVYDHLLLIRSLTKVVSEATPEGVKNIYNALFHPRQWRGLMRNLFYYGPDQERQIVLDNIAYMASNLIHLLEAIVERQLPENPQARSEMQADIAERILIFTSPKCNGHSLLGYFMKRIRAARGKEKAKAVISALHQTNLLPASADRTLGLAKVLREPVSEERTQFLNDSVSFSAQRLRDASAELDTTWRPERRSKRDLRLEALVHSMVPVVREECSRPFDMPTACRFIQLQNMMTAGGPGPDVLYRAEYLGLLARAIVYPENHSLAAYALCNEAVWSAMQSCALTRSDFRRLARTALPLLSTENRRAVETHLGSANVNNVNNETWNNPDFVQWSRDLGEMYHSLSTLEVRADWNRERLHYEVTRLLRSTFDKQFRRLLTNALRRRHLTPPADSAMDRIVRELWDAIRDEWVSRSTEEAERIFERRIHSLLLRIARDSQMSGNPEITRVIQTLATDAGVGGSLISSVLHGRAQEAPLPQAYTTTPSEIIWLNDELTAALNAILTAEGRAMGMRASRGTPLERLEQLGLNDVEGYIENLEMVVDDGEAVQALLPEPGESSTEELSPLTRVRTATHANEDSVQAGMSATDVGEDLRLLSILQGMPAPTGGVAQYVFERDRRVAWELGAGTSVGEEKEAAQSARASTDKQTAQEHVVNPAVSHAESIMDAAATPQGRSIGVNQDARLRAARAHTDRQTVSERVWNAGVRYAETATPVPVATTDINAHNMTWDNASIIRRRYEGGCTAAAATLRSQVEEVKSSNIHQLALEITGITEEQLQEAMARLAEKEAEEAEKEEKKRQEEEKKRQEGRNSAEEQSRAREWAASVAGVPTFTPETSVSSTAQEAPVQSGASRAGR